MTEPAPTRLARLAAWARSRLEPVSVVALVVVVALLELWAIRATDHDFWLPDPYRYVVLWLLLTFVVATLVRNRVVRLQVFLVLGVLPAVAGLVLEYAYSDSGNVPEYSRMEVARDPILRYTYRPGYRTPRAYPPGVRRVEFPKRTGPAKFNSHHLWDWERPLAKPPGVFRIEIVGDSVPNDGTIHFIHRFPHLLQKRLDGTNGWKVEVLNVSCEGYNTTQEVRLLEDVGLAYHPDLVVLAYVLNDPFVQNGARPRFGNSFFLSKLGMLYTETLGGGSCKLFARLAQGYEYDLVVRTGFDKLALLSQLHHVPVMVAILPIVAPFDDKTCAGLYDQVAATAKANGLPALEVYRAFQGEDYRTYLKPKNHHDITHPNAAGHVRMADALAKWIRPRIPPRPAATATPTPAPATPPTAHQSE